MRKHTKLLVLCLALLTACLAMTSFAASFNKVTEYKGTFTDVPENQWYAKEVASAYELGFVNGKSETTFDPNGTMTVAEAITVASRVHASYNGKTIPAVSGGKWYDMYVQYAIENGILEAKHFNSLDRTVRRYEVAVLFANALPKSHFNAVNNITAIPDVNQDEEYAEKLLMLYKAGVVLGSDEYGTFYPTNPIKRSEVSAIVNRTALPENRVKGTLTPMPSVKEGYYLIDNYTMTSSARQQTRLISSWNYDNRNEASIIRDGAVLPTINDSSESHYAAINRSIKPQTTGVMTFVTTYTISGNTKNGIRFYFADSDGNSVVEFVSKDDVYSAVSGGMEFKGSVAATGGSHVMKAVMDLDNKKGYLVIDGVKSVDFDIAPFSDFAKINLSTTVEDKISVTFSRCHVYMNYAVNEEFFTLNYPHDWEKAENTEIISGNFDSYGTSTLKLNGSTTVTKKFDALSGKFVFESFVLVPQKTDTAYVKIGDVTVKLSDSVISSGSLTKTFMNHIWQCIHIEGDTNSNKAKLYVNGKIQGEVPMNADSVDSISFTFEKKSEDGYMYVDDVEVYNTFDYPDYCPVPVPANKGDDNTVIMSVCSLWREGTHYGWDYVSPYDECSPLLGYYDEGVPETADWETKFMVEHGVDAFQYCWYSGATNTWDQPLKTPRLAWSQHDGYFYSRYSDMIDFCFMWENAGFNSVKMNLEQFETFLWDYWVEWYFTDPRYLCIDNKPVLHIYRMDYLEKTFGSVEAVKEVIDFMREDIKNYGFDGIIILFQSMDYSAGNLSKYTQMGGDGIMAYAYGSESSEPEFLFNKHDDGYNTLKSINSDLYLVPTVATGRNIMGWRNERTPLSTVEQHASVLEYFKPYVRKQNIPGNMVYLSTWNEYGEGHWIAPSGLNGFGYADEWRKAYTSAPEVHDDILPTINQKNRICRLYDDTRTHIRSELLLEKQIPTSIIKEWNFNDASDIDGWSNFRYQSVNVEDGVLKCVSTETDPIVRTPENLTLKAEEIVAIKFKIRSDVSSGGSIFFVTDLDNTWHGDKGFRFNIKKSEDGHFDEMYVDLTSNPYWKGNITCLRFDFIEVPGNIEVDDIQLLGPADSTTVIVDGVDLEYPVYYIEKTADEFYLAGDPDYGIYSAANLYYEWNRWTGKLFLKAANDTEFEFTVGSNKVLINGKEQTLAREFALYDGIPVLPMKLILDNSGVDYTIDGNLELSVRDINFENIEDMRKNYQFEFNVAGDMEGFVISYGAANVDSGKLVVSAKEASSSRTGHDTQITLKEQSINTADYSKVEIRIKAEYLPNKLAAGSKEATFYFATNLSPSLSEQQSVKVDLASLTPDSEGFVTAVFDLSSCAAWKGVANLVRFDPTNENGVFYVDYIRFVRSDGAAPSTPSAPTTPSTPSSSENNGTITLENVAGNATLVYDMDFVSAEDEYAAGNIVRAAFEFKDGLLCLTATPGEKDVIIGLNLPDVLKDSKNYDFAVVRYKVVGDYSDKAELFFINETMSSYAGDSVALAKFDASTPKDADGFYILKLDFKANANWKGAINSIRFDPANIADGKYEIDYIKFYKAEK